MTEVMELRTHPDNNMRLAPGYIHRDTDGDWWITDEGADTVLTSGNFQIVTPDGRKITKHLFVADWERGSQLDIESYTMSVPLVTW